MITLFRLLARLPLTLLRASGALLGLAVFVASPAYRAKIDANLSRAGLDRRLRWACARQAGVTIGELPFVWFAPLADVVARVRCDDLAMFEQARNEGRGVLVLTPHLGSFEAAARYLSDKSPITVLFKPPKQAPLASLLQAARNQGALRSAPTNLSGVRALLRALRAGEVVGLLPDQVPDAGQGAWADFFGEPAYTLTLPQRLAEQAHPAVILGVCIRDEASGGWRLQLRRLSQSPAPGWLNAQMQVLIMRWPQQYLWGYNRYKQPRGERS
jgi:KDO2-lipid IV(A) lauroyltransferase